MNQKGFVHLLLLPIVAVVLIGGLLWYMYSKGNIQISFNNSETKQTETKEGGTKPTTNDEQKSSEETFCKNYGTFEIKKTDLFEEYSVGPGETLRDLAKKLLNDETKATDFVDVNPSLKMYEVDDEIPMRTNVYVPNEKYVDDEGVITAYIKARGNISYNETKPMFGVNAPNSGTGPFIISDRIKKDLQGIKDGECVEVIYGSRGFDPQKVVFEVKKQ